MTGNVPVRTAATQISPGGLNATDATLLVLMVLVEAAAEEAVAGVDSVVETGVVVEVAVAVTEAAGAAAASEEAIADLVETVGAVEAEAPCVVEAETEEGASHVVFTI